MGTNWIDGPDGLREYPPYRQTAYARTGRQPWSMMFRRAWASFWRILNG